MQLTTTLLIAASLVGCGGLMCKSEDSVRAAKQEAARENEARAVRTTARMMRERNATRIDAVPVVLRTTCFTRTPPADGKGTFEGWTEPIAIACDDFAPFINQAKPLEALTTSGKRVLIVRASVEHAVTLGRDPQGRLLMFRAVPYPDPKHARTIVQCGRCSGLSDAWAEGPPETRYTSAYVLEGWSASSAEWVTSLFDALQVYSRCQDTPPE